MIAMPAALKKVISFQHADVQILAVALWNAFSAAAISGSIAVNEVAYGTGADQIGGDVHLQFNPANTGGVAGDPTLQLSNDTAPFSDGFAYFMDVTRRVSAPASTLSAGEGIARFSISAAAGDGVDELDGLYVVVSNPDAVDQFGLQAYSAVGAHVATVTLGKFDSGVMYSMFIDSMGNPADYAIKTGLGIHSFGDNVGIADGKAFRGDATTAHTYSLDAYDVDAAAYVKFVIFTNGNAPSVAIAPPAGGGTVSISANTLLSVSGVIGFVDSTAGTVALKRSTTTLQTKLGDDSAFGDFGARNVSVNGGVFIADNAGTPTPGITTTVTTASLVGKTLTIIDGIVTGFA